MLCYWYEGSTRQHCMGLRFIYQIVCFTISKYTEPPQNMTNPVLNLKKNRIMSTVCLLWPRLCHAWTLHSSDGAIRHKMMGHLQCLCFMDEKILKSSERGRARKSVIMASAPALALTPFIETSVRVLTGGRAQGPGSLAGVQLGRGRLRSVPGSLAPSNLPGFEPINIAASLPLS